MADIFVRDANLVSLMEKTGYNVTQENGQTKIGPPRVWTGPPPPKGSEIFIGKLPRDVYEDELVPLCEQFGKIYELRLMKDFNGENKGYSFLTYTKIDDATKAIKHLAEYEIRPGLHIKVCRSTDNCKLFVGGITKDKSKEEIMAEISKYTEGVSKVILCSNVVDKSSNKGFAFVEYESHRAANIARYKLLASKIKLFDHSIFVDWAKNEAQVEEETMKRPQTQSQQSQYRTSPAKQCRSGDLDISFRKSSISLLEIWKRSAELKSMSDEKKKSTKKVLESSDDIIKRYEKSEDVEPFASKSTVVLADYYESYVQNLKEMGYGKHEVEKALTECGNDPDRAIEYLINMFSPKVIGTNDPPSGTLESQVQTSSTGSSSTAKTSIILKEQVSFPSMSNTDDEENKSGNPAMIHDIPYRVKRKYDNSMNTEELEPELHDSKKVCNRSQVKVKVEGMNLTNTFLRRNFYQFGHLLSIENFEDMAILTYAKKDENSVKFATRLNNSIVEGILLNVSLSNEDEIEHKKRFEEGVRINFPGKVTYRDVKKFFESVGKPSKIYINEQQRYGFVHFKSRKEVNEALKLNGKIIRKIKLFVNSLKKNTVSEIRSEEGEKEQEEKKNRDEEKKEKEEDKLQQKQQEEKTKGDEEEKIEKEKTGDFTLQFYQDRNLF